MVTGHESTVPNILIRACFALCLAALAAAALVPRRHRGADGHAIHPRERPRRGGDPGPAHAGRHPHAVVPRRRGRRAARQVRDRAFPRAPDVQGHGEESGGPVLAASCGDRRPGERVHVERLHRLLPARRARAPRRADGIRGRPHDRPGADRRRHRGRAQRDPGGAQSARRERAVGASFRAGHGGAVSESSLSQADHRLAPRDGDARPDGCARVLQAVLHAGQCRAGGGGRRHARRR